MQWSDYYTSLTTMLQVADEDGLTNLNLVLMRLIDETELYLFRHPKLDFLATRTTDATQTTTSGRRGVMIPPLFVVVDDVALMVPDAAGVTQRVMLMRVNRPWLDTMYPAQGAARTPKKYETYYAIDDMQELQSQPPPSVPTAGQSMTSSQIYIGPAPAGGYTTFFYGTFRPPPFSTVAGFDPSKYSAEQQFAETPSAINFLSTWFPDLYLAASLVFGSGYQKNFGSQSDNPQQALSWTQDLERLIAVAGSEEYRKKAMSWDWGMRPMPDAAGMGGPRGGGGGAVPPVGAAPQ